MPMAPTALAAPAQTGVDASGNWTAPGPGFVANETNAPGVDTYIVRHQAPSLAQYRGTIAGLAPTSPEATGAVRLDARSAASQAYLSYLSGLHGDLAAAIQSRVGRQVEVVHRYDAVFNGIAVRMTAAEAQQVSSLAGVRSITRDYSRELLTDNGPRWIGADAIWGEEPPSGNAPCVGNCGEGIVVGIIDTGVNHDHPSFADVGGDGYDHSNPRGQFYGACDPITGLPFCNDKLIGFYDFTGSGPEDDHGHGSHTASTTAGNVLDIELTAPTITVPRAISGVAPHANVISYKGCSGTPVGCLISALIGSINAATLDGVDVINYSIGGASANPWTDLDAQAFFDAYTAGIFVATSAGNDGPGFGTLGSPADAPWVTSVAASTHDRKLANGIVNLTNEDGSAGPDDIFGASLTAPLDAARVVYAGDYGAALCGAGTGDPATGEGSDGNPFAPGTFSGEIVVCDRGEYGRVHKSENVMEAGAGGYVLANDSANGDSLVGDAYPLPGVHISFDNGVILKAWIAANGGAANAGTGEINGSNPSSAPENGDIMASFSSRGANPAAPSVIKPDVTAPGVDILAAWMTAAGTLPGGAPEYGVISGTSMSSPHTAGSGALVLAANPTWSPDEVKSALMTTAFTTAPGNGSEVHGVLKEDGATPADPFDMGAGRVDLHVAANAGFVLDESAANYDAANPGVGGDATTLNMASLGDNDCGSDNVDETCSWTRTIKSTLAQPVSWSLTSSVPAGMTVTASPSFFTLAPGASQEITFTADVSGVSPKDEWTFAEVQFTPSDGSVPPAHFPVAVIPKSFGGSSNGQTFYFHGNLHDYCEDGTQSFQAKGELDVVSVQGCLPFLSADPLDTNPAATWGPVEPGLNGSINDPHWIWNISEDTRIVGNMVVEWWASQAITTGPTGLFDTNFDITLSVDDTPIVVQRVAHTFQLPGQPQRLSSSVVVPDTTVEAGSVVELKIDPIFVDTGRTVTFYYDSEQACGAASSGECDSQVSMPIRTGPLPPLANDDAVFMASGATVTIDVLANDFDPEGGPLSVEIVTGPANGTADITLDNAIVYTHDGSATSSDTIEYRITDIDGLSSTAFVNLTIAAECLQPADDYFDDFEDGAPGWMVDTATLLAPSNTWQLTNLQLFPQSGSYQWFTDADAQDPVDSADTTKDVRLVSPAQYVSGASELTFWHRFSTEFEFDGGVLEISTDDGSTWEDIVGAGGVITQGGYTGTLSSGSGFALAGRQAWTGQSDSFLTGMDEVKVDLAFFAGQSVQVRFRFGQDVLLLQPAGGWWIDDVRFTNLLEACPSQAPIARPDSDTVTAGGSKATNVKANDSDPDNANSELTIVQIVTQPQHGTAVIMSPDSIEYTHNGNTATMDSYEYRLEDPDGNFDTAIVTMTIDHGVNVAPVAGDDADTVDAGQSVTVDVKANDSDANHANNELTVTIETSPGSGVAGVNADGSITYTHNGDAATSDTFDYRITDPQGAFDIATVSITINQENVESCRNDLCADDEEPDELTLTFVGGTCADSNNSQGSKSECTDHVPSGASGTVMIRATNKEDADYDNAKVYFEGMVSESESFTVSAAMAGEDDFGSKVFVHIYSADGTTLLQTIEIHTSCSAAAGRR